MGKYMYIKNFHEKCLSFPLTETHSYTQNLAIIQ